MYNTKNYTEQNGEVTVIGGKLIIEGTLEYADGADVPSGEEVEIPVCGNQADSTATTIAGLKEDFNALLSKLKTAGLMEADAPAADPEPEAPGGGE